MQRRLIQLTLAAAFMCLGVIPNAYASRAYQVGPVKDGGILKGRVFFTGEYPKGKPLKVTKDSATCGSRQPNEEFVVDGKTKGLKNAIVLVHKVRTGKAFPESAPIVSQKKCRYDPHVQVVKVGAFGIKNTDNILHNIHAYRDPDGAMRTLFNIAQPGGAKQEKTLESAGPVSLRCDVHPWMSGWVVAHDNPYFAITAADGSYEIDDIPSGKYTVEIWHEGLGSAKKKMRIKKDEATQFDFPIGE